MRDPESAPHAQAHQLLQDTRELVVRGWSAGARARDVEGRPVDPTDPSASSWSLAGALEAAAAGHAKGRDGDGEFARARAIALAALSAAIRGTPSGNEALRYLEGAIRELAPSDGRRFRAATMKAKEGTVAVRCLQCGTTYARRARVGTVAGIPGCPRCGYQGWAFVDAERRDGQDAH
jgi:predicted RNA-binding Zn-ribbon protein involved in translation (DUF1610 family)